MKGVAQRGNQLAYGSFGIKALESTWITGRQIEAARQAITRYMKREGQIWIRIFPDKPITKVGTLGIKTWICHGTVYGKRDLFEIAGASSQQGPQQGGRKGGAPKKRRNNK